MVINYFTAQNFNPSEAGFSIRIVGLSLSFICGGISDPSTKELPEFETTVRAFSAALQWVI